MNKSEVMSFWINPIVRQRLEHHAKETGMSFSQLIRESILAHLPAPPKTTRQKEARRTAG